MPRNLAASSMLTNRASLRPRGSVRLVVFVVSLVMLMGPTVLIGYRVKRRVGRRVDNSARTRSARFGHPNTQFRGQIGCKRERVEKLLHDVESRGEYGPVRRSRFASPRLVVVSRLDRIVSDPGVCHGQPVVRGLRYPVEMLLELLAAGMTSDEILADYPDLDADDLLAALEYGALAAGVRRVVPLGAA